MRVIVATLALIAACAPAWAATILQIQLDQQIDIGLGEAITAHSAFLADPDGGFVRKLLTSGNGAGGWYFGPRIDLVKAGYGPWVDMSGPGATIRYNARYYQGGGNTNPYGDAPIFVNLIDVNGKSGGLGISYGPNPNPTYPQWIEVVDDMTVGDWPTDAGFDLSKVVAIRFFGTDWAGVGDDFVDIRNLRIVDQTVHNPITVPEVKELAEGSAVEVLGAVSASFPLLSQFYIQDLSAPCGIQIRSASPPDPGSLVVVEGELNSDPATGELYVEATNWFRSGSGSVNPLGMTARALGGSAFGNQPGVEGGVGLNNVGTLVRICGTVTGGDSGAGWACVNDGSGLTDEFGNAGVRVDLGGLSFAQRPAFSHGDRVIVTGVSGVHAAGGVRYPVVRVRRASDFRNLDGGDNEPKTFRVLVVNFDPYCPGYGNVRTHQVFNWNDPHTLTQGYISDLANCSGGWCQYEVVDWFDANYHPYFEDGFQYTPDGYIYAWNNRHTTPMHPGTSDYYRLVRDKSYPHNQPRSIAERIAADEFEEVFFFGAPGGFAGWEAAMAGPSPFFVNGGTYLVPEAGRNFVMMGFNYERGVDCMLEDFLHRTECVLSRVYSPPSWWFPTYPPTNNWDRFRMFDKIAPGKAACGICHYAPNSDSDYDWGNTRYVWSTCDDWLYNWPNLLGDVTKRWVNCSEWGNGNMRLHHIWWLNHLPKAPGVNPDGKQNNWWKYSCDFNSYPESR